MEMLESIPIGGSLPQRPVPARAGRFRHPCLKADARRVFWFWDAARRFLPQSWLQSKEVKKARMPQNALSCLWMFQRRKVPPVSKVVLMSSSKTNRSIGFQSVKVARLVEGHDGQFQPARSPPPPTAPRSACGSIPDCTPRRVLSFDTIP